MFNCHKLISKYVKTGKQIFFHNSLKVCLLILQIIGKTITVKSSAILPYILFILPIIKLNTINKFDIIGKVQSL